MPAHVGPQPDPYQTIDASTGPDPEQAIAILPE